MKKISSLLAIILCILVCSQCKRPKEKIETLTLHTPDSASDTTTEAAHPIENPEVIKDIVAYSGPVDDSIRKALETFTPLARVHDLAQQAIDLEDSLELAGAKDSMLVAAYKRKAYQAILAYKQAIAAGISPQEKAPSLLQLRREVSAEDSSARFLPTAENSTLHADGKFFLLGGAPFIGKMEPENNTQYTDPKGNPEIRFATSVTENASYLLTTICLRQKERIRITFGPPLSSYEMGPQEIHGIGSLQHEFVNRIPVTFLTTNGAIPAHLVSITTKLVSENLGCVSDQPLIEFACSKSIEENDILAIYITYTPSPISCKINRPDNTVWTADINNDGIADIACVSGTAEGVSDIISEVLWFVNINGTWEIIDAGIELDCT